jgi:hypothetical protein
LIPPDVIPFLCLFEREQIAGQSKIDAHGMPASVCLFQETERNASGAQKESAFVTFFSMADPLTVTKSLSLAPLDLLTDHNGSPGGSTSSSGTSHLRSIVSQEMIHRCRPSFVSFLVSA